VGRPRRLCSRREKSDFPEVTTKKACSNLSTPYPAVPSPTPYDLPFSDNAHVADRQQKIDRHNFVGAKGTTVNLVSQKCSQISGDRPGYKSPPVTVILLTANLVELTWLHKAYISIISRTRRPSVLGRFLGGNTYLALVNSDKNRFPSVVGMSGIYLVLITAE